MIVLSGNLHPLIEMEKGRKENEVLMFVVMLGRLEKLDLGSNLGLVEQLGK